VTENGERQVTARELADKLDLIRQEQQNAHIRTRLWAVAASFAGTVAGKTVLAVTGVWGWWQWW